MSIWEAIVYAALGGACELLPLSFIGHATALRGAFNLWPIGSGEGLLVRAAASLGAALAILFAMAQELRPYGREFLYITGLRRRRRGQRPDVMAARGIGLSLFALVPVLLSFVFLMSAERVEKLPYIAALFGANGLLIYFGCRHSGGKKTEGEVTLAGTFCMGLARMVSVLPGLSGLGSSLAVGNACGLTTRTNLRISYLLALAYEIVAFFYFLIRGLGLVSLSSCLVLMLVALVTAFVIGYLAISYLRYLQARGRLTVFAYYCWEAAALVLILALINA